MRIDIVHEQLISIHQACTLFPAGPDGGHAVVAKTLWRWIRRGCLRGGARVRLEGVRCPKQWYTTREAVGRFLARLAELDRGPEPAPAAAAATVPATAEPAEPEPVPTPQARPRSPRTAKQRQRDQQRARAERARLGI